VKYRRCCDGLAQGEKHDSSRVVLTGHDLGDQVQNHSHTNNADQYFTEILLVTAMIMIQIHRSNKMKYRLVCWGLMDTRVWKRSMYSKILRTRVSSVSEISRVFQPASLKMGICCGLQIFWWKKSNFRFWLVKLGELGGFLICLFKLEKNQVTRVLRVNCYISVKLKFRLAWVQRDPVKITTSVPVKVQDFERAWFCASH
jgi:hypothetical protein